MDDWSFVGFSNVLLINSCPVTLEMTSHALYALFRRIPCQPLEDEYAQWDPLTVTEKALYHNQDQFGL